MRGCDIDKQNLLHFQHTLYDLQNGYFEVLQQDDFCKDLQQYLKRLFDYGHKNIIVRIVEKLGACVEQENCQLRAKALGVVTEFSKLLQAQKDNALFRIVDLIMTRSAMTPYEPGCSALTSPENTWKVRE